MSETRKTITLPSGATVKVRKLSALDLAIETGEVRSVGPSSKSKPTEKDIEFGLKVVRIALTKCTGKVAFPTGAKKIVDKGLDDSNDATEITIEELDQADADAIVSAVFELSGIGGAANAAKFPEEQAANGGSGLDSPALPQAAV